MPAPAAAAFKEDHPDLWRFLGHGVPARENYYQL
jgi:hypothetical protein